MVLIESLKVGQEPATNCEVPMDSGRKIYYVAPRKYSGIFSNDNSDTEVLGVQRKLSGSNAVDETDKWESANDLCQYADNCIEIEKDVEMFDGKSVLEIGFCTGLPSVFAFANGASSVTMHTIDATGLESFVKPTLRRNKVPRSQSKFSSGDLENCKRALSGPKFDVILAPELLNTDEADFEMLHEILDLSLAQNGIVLFSSRAYYSHCSGSLPTFLDLVKLKGSFDADVRWTSPKSEVAPRKIIALTRSIR